MTSNLTNTSFELHDSLITVKKKEITAEKFLPTQVCFELSNSDLKKIKNQRNGSINLQLSTEMLADLRYYCLLQNSHSLDSRLIFTTYYVKQQQKIAVIKTIIYLQGKISQQISRSFLHHPQLLKELITTHYWLISQISDRLFFKYKSKTSLLTWVLSLVLVLLIAPFLFYVFSFNWLIKLIILVGIWLILYLATKILLKRYLSFFVLQQLLFGFFSKNIARRRLGFILLRYFG